MKNGAYTIAINVSSFTTSEHAIIQQVLVERFQLKTSLQFGDKGTGQTNLLKEEDAAEQLKGLVEPYILPSLRRKIYEHSSE